MSQKEQMDAAARTASVGGGRMSDLISRQAAINAIENTDCEISTDDWDELTDAIMQLPSAEPKWIPVTERLPEESGYYLITSKCGDVFDTEIRFFFFQHERRTKWKEGFGEVIAWMPLPKPYEGVTHIGGKDDKNVL